ncbi:3339_t:CDS:1, partial [Funneliformis mosseae]
AVRSLQTVFHFAFSFWVRSLGRNDGHLKIGVILFFDISLLFFPNPIMQYIMKQCFDNDSGPFE